MPLVTLDSQKSSGRIAEILNYKARTHPSLSAMTVLYNSSLCSLYLPFLTLRRCIPASLPRYPSHTSPPANSSYAKRGESVLGLHIMERE
ncbi:hypothetical protein Q5P01_024783 [Channa striata]|uniref:Uncharacterized protein n=1 Tax=Channa striata TaxID=64152 RepID=A0AA88LN75_CHASR|nr:hypothetical protein Q5P01_024783 [Channa striata]